MFYFIYIDSFLSFESPTNIPKSVQEDIYNHSKQSIYIFKACF